MNSVQDMLKDIHAATDSTDSSYKSIQEMVFDIWKCIVKDEETGKYYLNVKSDDSEPTALDLSDEI